MNILVRSASAVVFAMAATTAFAAEDHSAHMSHVAHAPATATATAAALSEGEIKKVDRQARRITIKHGPLANLNMPPMTMAFKVSDDSQIDSLNTGDRIKFVAGRQGAAYVVSRVERMQ